MSNQSPRHSFVPRQPDNHSHDVVHTEKGLEHGHGHHGGVHLKRDEQEALAEKIMAVGSDYVASKTEARYSEDEVSQGVSAVAHGPEADALANKIMKEAARELERSEGSHVDAGSVASMAQRAAHYRNDPSAPEHAVKEKVRERIERAEEHAGHHTFEGPNPDKGRDKPNEKLRHFKGSTQQPYVTGGFRNERNPDVMEPRGG